MHSNKMLKWAAFLDFGLLGSVAFIQSLDIWVRVIGGIVGIILAGFLIWQIIFHKRAHDIDVQIKERELQIRDHDLYERMQRSKQIPEKKRKVKFKR